MGEYLNCRGSPTAERVLSATPSSPAQVTALGRGASRAFGFEGHQGLIAGAPQD